MAKKINITISEELFKRLSNYCEENYLTKSGVITMAVTDYLNSRDMAVSFKNMSESITKLADLGVLDSMKSEDALLIEKLKESLSGTECSRS